MTSQEQQLTLIIEAIAHDVNGFIGASVVDLESGMALTSISRRPEFDLDVASAYNAEMVKAKSKTIKALGLTSQLEDMLLTLDDQLHLITMLSDDKFLYVAADRQSTNLAVVRSVVNRHVQGFQG